MAVNQWQLERNWDAIKQQLHRRWDQVSEEELESTRGDVEQMIGIIQYQSGTGRRTVEQYLEELTAGSSWAGERVSVGAAAAQDAVQHAGESIRSGYERTATRIQQRPLESALVCFSAGLMAGLLLNRSLASH